MQIFHVFVASPSDLRPERQVVRDVVTELNNSLEYRHRAKFVAHLYEDSAPAVVGPEPQVVVDEYVLQAPKADAVVCMFWNRRGSPVDSRDPDTGLPYASGTEYELMKAYRHFRQHGSPVVLLYRCTRQATLDEAAAAEAQWVDQLFERFSSGGSLKGLTGTFTTGGDFRTTLRSHLVRVVDHKFGDERTGRLRSMFADHTAFIADRLARFVGRDAELNSVQELITQKAVTGGYITITGQAGQGKSSLIARLVERAGIESTSHHFIPINPGPDHQVILLRNLIARLVHKHGLSDIYLASETRPLLRDAFPKVLADLAQRGGREVIFIDGLDQLQDELNGERDLSFLPTRLPPGIVCVLGTRPNDALRPLELLSPHQEYALPPLSRTDFLAILERCQVQLDRVIADRFYEAMNANALYLDLLARELASSEHADPETIIRRLVDNPDNMFTITLDRLRKHRDEWRSTIKPLLAALMVAQEPLHQRTIRRLLQVDTDSLSAALVKLGGLIAFDAAGRCHLYHLKFRDHLRASDRTSKVHLFDREEEREWHALMAAWCERAPLDAIWQDASDPAEQDRRAYAREHYVTHLYLAERWGDIGTLLHNGEFGKAKLRHDPSTRAYGRDLTLGCRALLQTTGAPDSVLPTVWRLALLRASLVTKARTYPEELFSLLVLKGRINEALELVDLMPAPERKVAALSRIAQACAHEKAHAGAVNSILMRAEDLSHGIVNLWIHARAYDRLLTAVLAGREWDHAVRIAFRFGDARERVGALGRVAATMAAAGEFDRMMEVIDHYRQLGRHICHPGALEKTFAVATATDGSIVADAIVQTASEPVALVFAAHVLIGQGRVDEVDRLVDRITTPTGRAEVLLALVRHFVVKRDRDSVGRYVDALTLLCGRIEDYVSRSDTVIATALLLAQSGTPERAIGWLAECSRAETGTASSVLGDTVHVVSALVALVEDVSALENADAALRVVLATAGVARQAREDEQRRIALKMVGDAASRIGHHDLAGRLLVEAGGAPLALFGDLDAVLEGLSARDARRIELEVSVRYLENLLAKHEWSDAIDLARSEPAPTPPPADDHPEPQDSSGSRVREVELADYQQKTQSYLRKRVSRSIVVVRALLQAGEPGLARSLVEEVVPLLPRLDGAAMRASAAASCAEALGQLGERPRAIELAVEAFDRSRDLSASDQLEVLITVLPAATLLQHAVLTKAIVDRFSTVAEDASDRTTQTLALRYVVRALSRTDAARLRDVLVSKWMFADSREEIVDLLPIASPVVAQHQAAGDYLASSFAWVDEFLTIT